MVTDGKYWPTSLVTPTMSLCLDSGQNRIRASIRRIETNLLAIETFPYDVPISRNSSSGDDGGGILLNNIDPVYRIS